MIGYFKAIKEGKRQAKLIASTVNKGLYYTHIDELPVYNFFKIMKGEYKYLWKEDIEKEFPKGVFIHVFNEMQYQFNYLNNDYRWAEAIMREYESKWVRSTTKREKTRWRNAYTTQKKKVETWKTSDLTLDEFTDHIESTFNFAPGSIDVHKISTSKAFHSYQKAIETVKRRMAKSNNN